LYAAGENDQHQLGRDSNGVNVKQFIRVVLHQQLSSLKLAAVSGGIKHTVLLTSNITMIMMINGFRMWTSVGYW
jgi:hypothetical protein